MLLRSGAKFLDECWGLLLFVLRSERAALQRPVVYPDIHWIAGQCSRQATCFDPSLSYVPLREDATWKSSPRTVKNPDRRKVRQDIRSPHLLLKLNHRWIASTALLIVPRLLFATDCCVEESSGEPLNGRVPGAPGLDFETWEGTNFDWHKSRIGELQVTDVRDGQPST
jgi:hypothetical protein